MSYKSSLTIIILIILAAVVFLFAEFTLDPRIPILPYLPEAAWISAKYPPNSILTGLIIQDDVSNATFLKRFYIDHIPESVKIDIAVFGCFAISINDRQVVLPSPVMNWKVITEVDIKKYLQVGDNTIKVKCKNSLGPPFLWAHSKTDPIDINTGPRWLAAFDFNDPKEPLLMKELNEPGFSKAGPKPFQAMKSHFFLFVSIFLVFLGLILFLQKISFDQRTKAFFNRLLVAIPFLFVGYIFFNNFWKFVIYNGFDASGHFDYVVYILAKGALPAATAGRQMYHPPLYYVLGAILYKTAYGIFLNDKAVYALRLISYISGLGQVAIVYLTAKLVYREDKGLVLLSVIIAALLPVNIYISHNVSNEPLAALFVSLAIFFTIRSLKNTTIFESDYLKIGALSGVSVLTKISGIMALPSILLAMTVKELKGGISKTYAIAKRWGTLIAAFILCGGFIFGWNLYRYGCLSPVNWYKDPLIQMSTYQYPGVHDVGYFFRFGRTFIHPFFAGVYSFWDSFYSTFLGDGLISGCDSFEHAPPWNYSYMACVYLLGVPLIALFVIGLRSTLKDIIGKLDETWILLVSFFFTLLLSLFYMCMAIPHYSQGKAFYILPIIVPFSIISAAGARSVFSLFKDNALLAKAIVYSWLLALAIFIFNAFKLA